MKQLLVAFDFSHNAHTALNYAINFANKTRSPLGLVWVDSSHTPDNLLNIDYELRIEIKDHFQEIEQKYGPMLEHGKLEVILRKGKVYNELAMVARKLDADIIFAGTHGVSGYEQYWIGSNAYRIVTNAPCPVITIRGDYECRGCVRKILLPIDSTAETKQKLPFAAGIAGFFDAEVHLLVLYNSPISVIRKRMYSYAEDASKFLEEKGIKHIIKELESDKISSAILDYATEIDADLISIMTEQGTTTAHKFLGPYAQQLINNSVVPVLSIQSGQHEL
jgi:nucleotide-binding universal stress UspA family protein